MKKITLSFVPLFFLFQLFGQTTPKVLIIGIDGCRPDALQFAQTPNIDNLITESIYSMDALNTDITSSGPGWSAMLTGVWSDKHGVTNNSFAGSNYDVYPHFFQRLENFDPSLHTASICHWSPINDYIVNTIADYKLNVSSDQEVANQAVNYLATQDPDAFFLHFDDVDHAGHAHGFSKDVPQYIASIEGVDSYLGMVISAMEQRPNFANEDWLVLVSTDHGGIGFSHGGNSFDEQNIFFIASNSHYTPKEMVKDSSTMIVPPPFNCLNESIELNFDTQSDFVNIDNSSLFEFGANQDFTIECRVRTTTAADVSIVGDKDWDSGNNKGFVFSFKYASGPEWKVNIGDGSNRADINTGGDIADGMWHTLSVSFDRNGEMKMYEDGQFVAATDISFIGDITTPFDLRFGVDGNSAYDYTGSIAEVRVWNKVVNANTIAQWFCSPLNNVHPDYSSLLGYWKMNDGVGSTTVADFSGNGNDGTINNAQWLIPDTIITTYDFSKTPRIVDVALSALSHLCIPINSNWLLEGTSQVPSCVNFIADNSGVLYTIRSIDETLFISGDLSLYAIKILDSNFTTYQTLTDPENILIDKNTLPVGTFYISIIQIENQQVCLQKILKE